MQAENYEQLLEHIRQIMAEVTGNDVDEIHAQTLLEEELGVIQEVDLHRVASKINLTFGINLSSEQISELETIEELVLLVQDETILG